MWESDKAMLGEILLVGGVSVTSIVGSMKVSWLLILWSVCSRELNDHIDVENEENWITWCQ